METKKAVLVTSFGTSHLDALEKDIAAIEKAIARAMPDYTIRRAFTSTIIMKKLRTRDGIEIDDVPQSLTRLAQEGYSRVVLQPTHVLCGEEYDKLCALAAPFANSMVLSIGTPLLKTIPDYWDMARAVCTLTEPPAEDEAVVFMGHGTPHLANASYALLQYLLWDLGWRRAFIGTVEGCPSLEQVIRRLKAQPAIRKVRLLPLMVVAGDHAKNDMAGEGPDSWRNQLEALGYEVSCLIEGIGHSPAIQALFVRHAREAADKL